VGLKACGQCFYALRSTWQFNGLNGMIALGFFASIAAFIASGEMAVAYFMMHAPNGPWPLLGGGNGGEPAVLYCFIFLYIASVGSGVWSIDAIRGRANT
jgi:putative oxidoreductase